MSANCANCHHGVESHTFNGCARCGCPFERDGGGFNATGRPVGSCPSEFAAEDGETQHHYFCDLITGHDDPHGADDPTSGDRIRWFDSAAVKSEAARDIQVGGTHYKEFRFQPWDVIDEYALDFYLGNVVKYVLRAGLKGPKLEDLKKARHYLDRVIEMEEGK